MGGFEAAGLEQHAEVYLHAPGAAEFSGRIVVVEHPVQPGPGPLTECRRRAAAAAGSPTTHPCAGRIVPWRRG